MPVVTVEDVLVGQKDIQIETRTGERLTLTVKAIDWRTALAAGFSTDPSQASIAMLENCLSPDQGKDQFLNSIVPSNLHIITAVASQLSQGINAAKARLAEQKS